MGKIMAWTGSPSLLAAVLVVVLGLVGTAVAGRENTSGLTRADIKRITQKEIRRTVVKKMVRNQIRLVAPRLSVARAKRADVAQRSEVARTAVTAERAEHATRANWASKSTSADTVDGIKLTPLVYEQNPGTGSRTIFAEGGFEMTANCEVGAMSIVARTMFDGSSIYSSAVNTSSNDNNLNGARASGTFDSGDEFDLLDGHAISPSVVTFGFDSPRGLDPLVGIITADQHSLTGACHVRGIVSSGYAVNYVGS